MKEICSNFDIIPVTQITAVIKNEVLFSPGKVPDTFYSDIQSLNVTPDNSDAGILYTINQDIVIDKLNPALSAKYRYPRYCILIIHYTDGTHTVYGDTQYPVEVYHVPGIQRDILSVYLQTTAAPVI